MGDLIRLLPDAIANQIAAGEVIQRPASVVKELLENALDAKAGRIQLILKEGGKQLIQVVDDGTGMSVTDARMCFERHATSKIRQADDLFRIRTMGFRGEALASIASVAQVELRTRREDDPVGTRLLIEASAVLIQEDCATAKGTSLSVRNLFFNVPARRKFLKSDQLELRHIMEEFHRVAMACPEVHFSLYHNDQEVFHLPPANSRQRVVGVLGPTTNARLVPVEEDTGDLTIRGFVGKPETARKTRGEQFLFINRRFVKSGYLHHAILSAYEELIGEDQHPLYVLFLDIDPARIDVNVHPTKHEIKFEDERLVYHFVKVSVRHALGRHGMIPSLDFEADHSLATSKFDVRSGDATVRASSGNPAPGTGKQDWQELFRVLEKPLEEENPQPAVPDPFAPAVLVDSGSTAPSESHHLMAERQTVRPYQIHQRYILTPIKSGFLLIDQQAAHERILYERFVERMQGEPARIQKELFPRTLDLNPSDAALLESMIPDLHRLGFDLEPFGRQSFILHGLPADMDPHFDAIQLLRQLLEHHRDDLPLKPGHHENLARQMARHAAIPRGTPMTEEEMLNLIDRLFACEQPYKSPGGRAAFITFELDDLDRRFRS